jgi:hypothetical protein
MANILTNTGIVDGQVILASQVTQIVDALTAADDYDISISGSLTVIGESNITASHAISASYAVSASYEIIKEESSSYAETASYVETAQTASYASTIYNVDGTINDSRTVTIDSGDLSFQVNSGDIKIALATDNENFVITGLKTESIANIIGINSTDDVVLMATSSIQNVVSSSYALTASYLEGGGTLDTGSFYISSSVTDATITFTQGDSSTEQVIVNNVNNAISSSYSLTASFAPGIRIDGLNDFSTVTNVKLLGITGVNATQIDSETAVITIISSSYAVTASYLDTNNLTITNSGTGSTLLTGNYVTIQSATNASGTPIGYRILNQGGTEQAIFTMDPSNGLTSLIAITGPLNLRSSTGEVLMTGSLDIKGNVTVSGSQVLTLEPVDPLPSGLIATGSFAVSASIPARPYMWDGSAWYAL